MCQDPGGAMQHMSLGFWPVQEDSDQHDCLYVDNGLVGSVKSTSYQPSYVSPSDAPFVIELGATILALLTEEEILRRVYHDLKQNGDDTRAIMSLVYDSKLTPKTWIPEVYLLQEQMLASVHDYILASFNHHKGAFSSNTTLDPSGTTEQDRWWKYVSDEAWGVGSLARQGNSQAAVLKLGTLNIHIETALETDSPQMMVRIWRICRYLLGVTESLRDPGLMRKYFLGYFRDLLKKTKGAHSPSFRLFDALSMMESNSLMHALRIGHLRAMQSFEKVVGTGHPVVLSMWTYYAHQWHSAYEHQDIIVDYYKIALDTADRELGPTSDAAISILHDYLYFVYYNIYPRDDEHVYHLALDLHNRIRAVIGNGPYIWSTKTQYLTFASQIMARVNYKLDHQLLAATYLEDVIELFWNSDVECRVRAAKLLRQLATWLLQWNESKKLEQVRHRERQLRESTESMLVPDT
ncbi:hypothetical protein ATEIFO6365_0016013500 [Aspergillus terreus]|uniref:Uncharacterized protein n=1 Tax=Aspergillus terreus TaxID=33178 RepID=A0A5M3ZE15_ASPTE|nr:hypothetical protein ATETN484_0017014000 [Aspergillus terreus]GFF21811.1 hypothetical protein ATEIFO6365_0016013500 [Aspergillus terreus]